MKRRGGGGQSFSYSEAGHKYFWDNLYTVAILKGGHEKFALFEMGGGGGVLPCLEGGAAQKVSDPQFSKFCSPPPHK